MPHDGGVSWGDPLVSNRREASLQNAFADAKWDYPLMIVEIRLDQDDRGDGTIKSRARLAVDKDNQLLVEHYDRQPVQITRIHKK